MKTLPITFFALLALCYGAVCYQPVVLEAPTSQTPPGPADSLLYQRFTPPIGFQRLSADPGSFPYYLRHLPLRPPGSKVHLFDGREKENRRVYDAVVDLPIGNKDLHQCADAVIRLRAEYLWQTKQFTKIHFNLTNGFRVDYERWRKGARVKVTGNRTEWVQTAKASDTYATFWQYLEFVFSYAGTISLSQELQSVPMQDIQIGDVFIQGGSPGHAIIVVDLAVDASGNKVFLLAQSYMPAQEIQILKNPMRNDGSAWYVAKALRDLLTPEWNFTSADLKRWPVE